MTAEQYDEGGIVRAGILKTNYGDVEAILEAAR